MEKQAKQSRAKRAPNEKLTNGEKLFIWRRRAGLNQGQAAKRFKVSLFIYKMIEYDKLAATFAYPAPDSALEAWELCVIYRRREGFQQKQVAATLGLSRNWIQQMEVGKIDCTRLLQHWEK